MVAVSSPDWLPAGWSFQFRSQHRGRRTEIYIDLETGKKFFSKDDVIRYTNKNTHCNEEPKSMNTKNPSHNSLMQVAAKTDEYPEWLPDGWKIELRTRKSGVHAGQEDKCYIDPSRECTFYSKPEVFRHLKTVKHNSCKSRSQKRSCINLEAGKKFFSKDDDVHDPKKTTNFHEESKSKNTKNPSHKSHLQVAVKTDEYPEWLPAGWKIELRTRKSGLQAGSEYKCYIDPSRECTLYSMPEVFRHLETVKRKSCKSKSPKMVVGENHNVEDLPPGWMLEIKLRKVANRFKRDPYYTDPVHGYIFRSKKEVFHYLQTGETNTHVIKPKGMPTNDLKMTDDDIQLSSATKKVNPPVTRQQLFEARKSCKLSGECVDAKGECSVSGLSNPKAGPSREHVGKRSSERLTVLPNRPEAKRSKLVKECVDTEGESSPRWLSHPKVEPSSKHVGRRSSPRLAGLANDLQGKTVNVALAPIAEAVSQNHLSESLVVNCAKTMDSSTRKLVLPKKIFKCEDETALVGGSSTDPGKGLFSDAPALTSDANTLNKSSRMSRMENRNSRRIQKDAKISKQKEKVELPRRSSKRLIGVEPEPVNSPVATVKAGSGTQVLRDTSAEMNSTAHGESSNKETTFVSDKEIPEEQHHRPEAEKMLAEKPGPDLCLLFGSDPCIEFAFKTLTGELPITDGVDKEHLQKPTADTVQKETSLQDGACIRKSRASSKKIKKAKAYNSLVPRRTSKRLGWVEPELLGKPISIERAHQNGTVYSFRSIPLHAVDSAHESPQPSEADQGNKLAHDSCTSASPSTDQESLEKIEKYDKSQSVPEERHLQLETEKAPILKYGKDQSVPEEKHLQLETEKAPVLKYDKDQSVPEEKHLQLETEKAPISKYDKDQSVPEEKHLLLETEKAPISKYGKDQSVPEEKHLQLETEKAPILKYDKDQSVPEEKHFHLETEKAPISKYDKDQSVPEEKHLLLETEKAPIENPVSQFTFPFLDTWSDPCLDFAFKTLTGEIPVDNMFPGCFDETLVTSHNQRDSGVLEDSCLRNFFESDLVSPRFSAPEQSTSGTRDSRALENSGLPNFFQSDIISPRFSAPEQSTSGQSDSNALENSVLPNFFQSDIIYQFSAPEQCTSGQRDSNALEASGLPNFFQSDIVSPRFRAPEQSTSGQQFAMNSQPAVNVSMSDCNRLGFGQQLLKGSSFLPGENLRLSDGGLVGSSQH